MSTPNMASRGASIKSTSINGVKLYSLSGQRSTATWLTPKKQRALRKDRGYQQRVDLIQDLSLETATTRIKATPDGEYVIASGIYPPQVKVYELKQLSMKFERHFISEIINFQSHLENFVAFAKLLILQREATLGSSNTSSNIIMPCRREWPNRPLVQGQYDLVLVARMVYQVLVML